LQECLFVEIIIRVIRIRGLAILFQLKMAGYSYSSATSID